MLATITSSTFISPTHANNGTVAINRTEARFNLRDLVIIPVTVLVVVEIMKFPKVITL